jgi:hypothetical protein
VARPKTTDGARARRGHEAPRGQEVTTEARDSEAALREIGGLEKTGQTQGADRGKEGPQGPTDRTRPEEAKGKVSAGEAATFAKSLADHAAEAAPDADAAAAASTQKAEPQSVQEQEPALAGPEEEGELDMRELRKNEAKRKGPKEFGGSPELVDPPGGPADSAPRASGGVRAVRPAARAGLLDLATLMAEAQEAGILAGYQIACINHEVQRLNHRDFDQLRRLLGEQPSRLHQATLLKALSAHRHLDDLVEFGGRIAEQSVDDIVQPQLAAVAPDCPGGLDAIGALRRHYDPISCLEGHASVEMAQPSEDPLPRWLRGLPRGPVEFAAIALHQALTDDLSPIEETREGASASLSRAWRPHGATHPGLERWLLRLAALAETPATLEAALPALMRTRDDVTKEPSSTG